MVFKLKWLRYFAIAFNTESVMFLERKSQLQYSVVLAPLLDLRKTVLAIEQLLCLYQLTHPRQSPWLPFSRIFYCPLRYTI